MIYLPAIYHKKSKLNVYIGRYTSPIDPMDNDYYCTLQDDPGASPVETSIPVFSTSIFARKLGWK